jgi:hypothetical protein
MNICSWYNQSRVKPCVEAIWLLVNQPVIVGVVVSLALPFAFQKYAECTYKRERVEKADLQIGNAVYLFQSRLNASRTCDEIATAVSLFNNPSPIYPEFKDVPMTGLIVDLMKNLTDEKSKYALNPAYEATSRLEALEPVIRKSCDVQSSKKLIREDYLGDSYKVRPWFNIPTTHDNLMK